MPSQVMEQRHHLAQYSHPIVAASSSEGLRLPIERQVGFWKPESLPPHHMGSKSVASSPHEKPQPYKPRDQKTAFSLEHKLFGQESHTYFPVSMET